MIRATLCPIRLPRTTAFNRNLASGCVFLRQMRGARMAMADTFRETELIEAGVPGVSWAAVTAGAVASLALTLLLLSFGAGMGFAVISPWGNSGVSATTFQI